MRAIAALAALGVCLPQAEAANVTVPVDVGIGPASYFFFGPVHDDQWKNGRAYEKVHYGLKISLEGVIDKATLEANAHRIPPKYKKLAAQVNEIRYRPSLLIPDSLIISPKVNDTGIYGVTWRPWALGLSLFDSRRKSAGGWRPGDGRGGVSLDLEAGLLLTYAFLHSDTLPTTHFLRPGVDLMLELEFQLSQSFLVSMGWASGLYVPQELGGFGVAPLESSIWHVGQAFIQLHVRFPYEAKL